MRATKTNLYEGLYIFRPTLSDEAREKALKKITTVIENSGGTLEKTIDWGRKKMAYEIKMCREGHYILIYFSLPTNVMDEVIRENHLHEDLLRYLHRTIEELPEGEQVKFKPLTNVER
jgi:small subunit ribosomal protein S6